MKLIKTKFKNTKLFTSILIFSIALVFALPATARKISFRDMNLHTLQRLISIGNAEAMSEMGYRYSHGVGVPQNKFIALKFYAQSAALNNAHGLVNLGSFYQYGYGGVSIDYPKAMHYYKLAVKAGSKFAYSSIGVMYYRGEGVKQDKALGKKYLLMAAEAKLKKPNAARTQFNLAFIEEGEGQYKDAIKWYTKSAENGFDRAMRRLAFLYEFGQGTPKNYKLSQEWFSECAKENDKVCANALEILQKKMAETKVE